MTTREERSRPSRQDAKEIARAAQAVLEGEPGAVVRLRLLRDVLRRPSGDRETSEARQALRGSACVLRLAAEQRDDGGWGAFHSRSTRERGAVPSTEVAVERALALGLERSDPVLSRAHAYLLSLLAGERPFPDRPERNDRWRTGVRLFVSSTLLLIEPAHPAVDPARALWREIAVRTFRSGTYREEDEAAAHAALAGATVRGSYLVLSGRYQLNVLGSVPGLLPEEVEAALVEWLWRRPEGIGYLGERLDPPPPAKPGSLDRWLASHELLARSFPAWRRRAGRVAEWLWKERSSEGFWDLGPRAETSTALPLSDSWRRKESRIADWSTRILSLLILFHEGPEASPRPLEPCS